MRIWILSAVHLVFGMIFLGAGMFELLKIDTWSVPELTASIWINMVIGASIIILGILFAKNTFKSSENSFFNIN